VIFTSRMIAPSQINSPWPSPSDSWNVSSAPPSYGSWSGGRALPSYDHCRDHRWDVEWSSFLPQWGPQSMPTLKAVWNGGVAVEWNHKSPHFVGEEAALEHAGWGVSRLAPQAVSKREEPQGIRAVIEQKDPSVGHGGRLPSVGSAGHDDGTCKRCAFFPKGRCKNGEDCTHCHFEHPKPLRSRRRKRCGKGAEMEDLAWSTSRKEEYTKDEWIDDASTQAGTTLASQSIGAESVGKATQPDDEACNERFDNDSVVSDAESVPSSGEIGSDSGEEELETENTTPSSVVSPTSQAAGCGHSESLVVSVDSWAARQRLHQLERKTSGTNVVANESADVEQSESRVTSPKHERSESKFLESTAGSWAVQQRLRRAEREENIIAAEATPEDIARKAKGLLNKLTQERFEPLCQQILDLPVRTAEQLAALVAEIFDKATTEKGFLTLYTELCARLDAHLLAEGSCVGGKVFRKALVTECQASFERNLQQPLDPETLVNFTYEDRYVEEVKHKTRTLGNMRFIGELLIRKLLAGKILFFIVNEMLDTNSEPSLESLVELLTVVAPVLERKGTIYEAPLRETFGTLRKKNKDMKLCMRIRCKISDLLDFRSNGWQQTH